MDLLDDIWLHDIWAMIKMMVISVLVCAACFWAILAVIALFLALTVGPFYYFS